MVAGASAPRAASPALGGCAAGGAVLTAGGRGTAPPGVGGRIARAGERQPRRHDRLREPPYRFAGADEAVDAGQVERSEDEGELQRVAGAMSKHVNPPDDEIPLTNRETQVLRHVALGLSNKEIARSLQISIETVKEHVQNILRKIAVTDRTQAAVWAVRRGLV